MSQATTQEIIALLFVGMIGLFTYLDVGNSELFSTVVSAYIGWITNTVLTKGKVK